MYGSTHLRTVYVRIDTFGGPPDLLKLYLKLETFAKIALEHTREKVSMGLNRAQQLLDGADDETEDKEEY